MSEPVARIDAADDIARPRFWGTRAGVMLMVAGVLLLSFLIQWPGPRVADWQLFSFYDPGTTLKGDMLIAKGYVPSDDFGYTHGLLSLVVGRVGFAILGRTWWAFLALTLLAEMGMAWALARIFWATGLARQWASLMFVLVALPLMIMPAYLTLTHPLEALLILLAMGAQAEGKKSQALALMTACLFVKPSMAYLYGLVLVVLIAWEQRGRIAGIGRAIWPAAVVLVVLFLGLSLGFGWMAVVKTVLPLTGAKTYASTAGFGFFSETTRAEFWWPSNKWTMLIGPAFIYLMAVLTSVVAAVVGAVKMILGRAASDQDEVAWGKRGWELLLTIGLLHTAFLFGFYGFHGSWTYYSYMPVLAMGLFVQLLWSRVNFVKVPGSARNSMFDVPWLRTAKFCSLTVLMLVSYEQMLSLDLGCWLGSTPRAAPGPGTSPGLWRYPDQYAAWLNVLKAVGDKPTLVMTNGYLEDLPSNIQMPDAWFPEPGIPTAKEIARVQAQVDKAEYVVLFGHLAKEGVELWTSREFAGQRAQFEEAQVFTWPNQPDNVIFTLLRRVKPAGG